MNENHYICNNSDKNYARILKIGYVVHDTFVLDCIKIFFIKSFISIFRAKNAIFTLKNTKNYFIAKIMINKLKQTYIIPNVQFLEF